MGNCGDGYSRLSVLYSAFGGGELEEGGKVNFDEAPSERNPGKNDAVRGEGAHRNGF